MHNVYHDLCEMSNRLTTISLENVTENERKTFFISRQSIIIFLVLTICFFFEDLYNILTIHGIASVNDLPKSVLDLNQFWKTTSYKVGAYFYSLDDILHGILRGLMNFLFSMIFNGLSFFLKEINHIRIVHNDILHLMILVHDIRCVD